MKLDELQEKVSDAGLSFANGGGATPLGICWTCETGCSQNCEPGCSSGGCQSCSQQQCSSGCSNGECSSGCNMKCSSGCGLGTCSRCAGNNAIGISIPFAN